MFFASVISTCRVPQLNLELDRLTPSRELEGRLHCEMIPVLQAPLLQSWSLHHRKLTSPARKNLCTFCWIWGQVHFPESNDSKTTGFHWLYEPFPFAPLCNCWCQHISEGRNGGQATEKTRGPLRVHGPGGRFFGWLRRGWKLSSMLHAKGWYPFSHNHGRCGKSP